MDRVAGNQREHILSNSWTGGQFSAGADNASVIMGVRRRQNIFPVQSVSRGSDSENQDLVENRLNNSNEGELASVEAAGTFQPRQRRQNQTSQNVHAPSETSPGLVRLSYWRNFGLKNTYKRFFRPRVAADSHRIEWTCVSINMNSIHSERAFD